MKLRNEHIIEVETVDEANNIISEGFYRYDGYSEKRDLYILVKRMKK